MRIVLPSKVAQPNYILIRMVGKVFVIADLTKDDGQGCLGKKIISEV